MILKKKIDKFNKEYFDNQDATALTCTGKLDKFITLKILKFNFLCRKPLTLGGKIFFFILKHESLGILEYQCKLYV